MHVARCVIISPFFLFSLSQSGTVFPPLSPSIVTLFFNFFLQCPHGGASHPFCFSTFHHRSSVPSSSPFFLSFLSRLSLSVSLSLSVMAYQDGFYGAADLYVSIALSPLLPRCSPTFSSSCSLVFKCETAWAKPRETCTFGCFHSLHRETVCFPYQTGNHQIFAYT